VEDVEWLEVEFNQGPRTEKTAGLVQVLGSVKRGVCLTIQKDMYD
jgi:hypothetical protein